jgi:predicted TIM-barrel fold metal-dependent hydrolase
MTLISADSHVVEPSDVWSALADIDGAPVVREVDGKHWWFVGDTKLTSFSGIQTGERFKGQEGLRTSGNISEVRAGGWDPQAHLEDNAEDGVSASVLYPTVGLMCYRLSDTELLTKLCHEYNNWIASFCAADPSRLKGMAMLNVDDPEVAAAELRDAHSKGLAGAMVPVNPGDEYSYGDASVDVLWKTASELGMPVGFHIGSERRPLDDGPTRHIKMGATLPNADYWVRRSLSQMILSGVFDRFPSLKAMSVEHEAGWVPFFLERLDYHYTQKALGNRLATLEKALPSDYYKSNVLTTVIEDRFVPLVAETVGAKTLMWGSDYPHTESSFPYSRDLAQKMLEGFSDDDVHAITRGNVAEVFGIAAG